MILVFVEFLISYPHFLINACILDGWGIGMGKGVAVWCLFGGQPCRYIADIMGGALAGDYDFGAVKECRNAR